MPFKVFAPTHPMAQGAPITPARRKRLFFSYLPDWLMTIVLAALFFSLDAVDGYRRDFSLEDTSLRHPYAVHERVPNLYLFLIAVVAPLCLMPIVNFITVRSYWDFHNSSLGLVLACALTGSVTQFVKITVGRPRPDVIDRCQPPPGLTDPPYKLTNSSICTQTDNSIMIDGFRSFPSGHSSLSFAGLGFLAFYLAGKLHLFDKRGHAGKAWLSLSPFCVAALIAISRSMDYRHHWHDILVGSLLGTVLSFFSYRQYYPSLTSPLSHRPYSPRIPNEDKPEAVIPMFHSHSRNPSTHLVPRHNTINNNTYNASGASNNNNSNNKNWDTSFDQPRDGDDIYYNDGETVPRPPRKSLTEVWKEGGEEETIVNPLPQRDTYPPPLEYSSAGAGVTSEPEEVYGGITSPIRNAHTTSAVMKESSGDPLAAT